MQNDNRNFINTQQPVISYLRTAEDEFFILPGSSSPEYYPLITGTAAANSEINLYNGNTLLARVTTNGQGQWQYQPAEDAPLFGSVTLRAQQDNLVSTPFSFTAGVEAVRAEIKGVYAAGEAADKEIPPGLTTGTETDDATPLLVLTGLPDSIVEIRDNGKLLKTLTFDDGGTASWTVTPPLEVGEHNFTLTSSVQSTETVGWKINVTQPAPVEEIIIVPEEPLVMNPYAIDMVGRAKLVNPGDLTDDTRPQFMGTAGAGQLVTLYDENNHAIGSGHARSDGKWMISPSNELSDGFHTIVAKTGNQVTPGFELVIQSPAGTPVVMSVYAYDDVGASKGYFQSGNQTDDTRPAFMGTAGVGELVTLYDENNRPLGSVITSSDGEWSLEIRQELVDGNNNIVAKSGTQTSNIFSLNLISAANTPVTLDQSAYDNVGVKGRFGSGDTTDDIRPTFSGSAGAGQIVTLYDENNRALGSVKTANSGYWSLEIAQELSNGYHTVTAKTATQISTSFAFNVDVPAPIPVTIDPQFYDNVRETGYITSGEGTTDDTRPRFTGTGPALKLVELIDQDGRALGSTLTNAYGTWVLEITADLHESVNQVYAKIAGTLSQPLEVIVDTQSDTPLSIDNNAYDNVGVHKTIVNGNILPTDDDQPTFTGSAKAGSLVTLVDYNGRELGSVVANSDGQWELEITSPLDQGLNRVTAQAGGETSNTFVLFVRSANVSSRSLLLDDAEDHDAGIANLLQEAQPELFSVAQTAPVSVLPLELTEQDLGTTTDVGLSVETRNDCMRHEVEEVTHY